MTITTTVSVAHACEYLPQIMDQVCEDHEPFTITKKGKNCILISEEDWDAIQEALYLASMSDNMQEILLDGDSIPANNKYTDHLPG